MRKGLSKETVKARRCVLNTHRVEQLFWANDEAYHLAYFYKCGQSSNYLLFADTLLLDLLSSSLKRLPLT